MIKLNCKQILKNFKGEPLKIGEDELTLGVAVGIIMSGQISNPNLAWILGKKFYNDNIVDLRAEEVVFLKKEVYETKQWNAIVTGQILELLEGTSAEVSK